MCALIRASVGICPFGRGGSHFVGIEKVGAASATDDEGTAGGDFDGFLNRCRNFNCTGASDLARNCNDASDLAPNCNCTGGPDLARTCNCTGASDLARICNCTGASDLARNCNCTGASDLCNCTGASGDLALERNRIFDGARFDAPRSSDLDLER